MKNKIITILLSLIGSILHGQTSTTIDINNINASVDISSEFFNTGNEPDFLGFEFPKGSGTNYLGGANFYISCLDTNGNKLTAHEPENNLFWLTGPISTNESTIHHEKYHRFWKVSKDSIELHQANFTNPSYLMPEAIKNWPGNGEIAYNESPYLAPYFDYNKNNRYDPEHGDYPLIKGEIAIYSIFHFNESSYNDFYSPKIELHRMVYAANEPEIANAIFVNYQVINKSHQTYSNVRLSNWMDVSIGNPVNEFVASVPSKNAMIAYYANNSFDDVPNAPALAFKFLNINSVSSTSYNYYYDRPNEENEMPFNTEHFYNYANAMWPNGTHLVEGGDGKPYRTGNPDKPVDHIFPGLPGSNVWNEYFAGIRPKNRRLILSSEGKTLNPEQKMCVEVAYCIAQNNMPDTNYNPGYHAMTPYLDIVQNHYDNMMVKDCFDPSTDSIYIDASTNEPCKGSDVLFKFMSNDAIPVYINWTFDGGTPSNYSGIAPPSITYDNPGTFNVLATIIFSSGDTLLLERNQFICVQDYGHLPSIDGINAESQDACKTLFELTPENPIHYGQYPIYNYYLEDSGLIHTSASGTFLFQKNDVENGALLTLEILDNEICGITGQSSVQKTINFFNVKPIIQELTPGTLSVSNTEQAISYKWYYMLSQNTFAELSNTSNTLEYPIAGEYFVEAFYTGICFRESDKFKTAIKTSVGIHSTSASIHIYPNPTSGKNATLTVEGLEQNASLQIINSLGQVMHTQTLNNINPVTIPTSKMSKGIYTIQLSNTKTTTTKQFIIN